MLRKCVCCGKEYDYCPGCHKKDQPGWMVTFCSESCKDLFNIVSAYNVKRIDKAAVRKYVVGHNMDTSKYLEPIQKVLNEVMETKATVMTKTPKTVESSPIILSNEERTTSFRARRNKKRRNKHVDIELN